MFYLQFSYIGEVRAINPSFQLNHKRERDSKSRIISFLEIYVKLVKYSVIISLDDD